MKTIYEFLLSEHLLKNKTAASTQDADYVDLGLPSRLLWATCNIGADEPTDYGDYFMWGSTEPDTNKPCDWKNCPFNDGRSEFNYSYFYSVKTEVCPNGILAPEYDAATVILGDKWRLPTKNEYKELLDNTKHEWIKNYKSSNVNGMIFEANGIELFIPTSGYRSLSNIETKGTNIYLWSSSIFNVSPYAATSFYIRGSSCGIDSYYRYNGHCLRGVKES